VERSGLMSSEMTEHERDGGLKADWETAAGLRGGRWQQSCGGKMAAELRRGMKAKGCKQHRGGSAGGLRGKNEPKGFVGWSSAEGPKTTAVLFIDTLRSGTERRRRPSGRG
jgi:hypothetical protein